MDHIGMTLSGILSNSPASGDVARSNLAAHRHAQQTKCQTRFKSGELGPGQAIAGQRITNDADLVAASRLLAGEIDDVTEQAPDRRAQAV
jgi:hypothetical protein